MFHSKTKEAIGSIDDIRMKICLELMSQNYDSVFLLFYAEIKYFNQLKLVMGLAAANHSASFERSITTF